MTPNQEAVERPNQAIEQSRQGSAKIANGLLPLSIGGLLGMILRKPIKGRRLLQQFVQLNRERRRNRSADIS
jgi:hypothetical protein